MYNHDHENEVTYFAKTNFRNSMTKFGIKTDDRRRHVYVIGKTGMGKTTLLENFILSDIYAGHGCCYVDPHGDTAEKLIDFIPNWRLKDVVYFNPSDVEYPVGFNILEAVTERHKHLVASGMMAVFAKIWEGMWSSRMEYILNNTILALLDNQGQTLLGINRMMSDADFRAEMVKNIKDPVVRQFWLVEFASWTEKYATEATAAIQNKIGQFLSSGVIRNVVAQVKSTMDIRQLMDEQKILIINLSKGRIGEDNSRLLGGLLVTKIQLSAMERVDTPEDQRSDFYLYVDEFQNFAVESFASILSHARQYRLCLTMAHQYIAQLTDEVREAVFGNVGTMITFRVGSPDGLYLEKEYAPRFLPEDIINRPKYNIYLKLLIDGVTSQPFSAVTLPPIAQVTGSAPQVIDHSRKTYANPREVIEKHILDWSGMGEISDEKLLEKAQEKKKAAKADRKPKHEYNCTRCDKHMVLPVELDRSRPIYCEDCIDIVREERKNNKKKKKSKSSESKPVKVNDGKVVEKEPEKPTPALSLDALKKPAVKERKEEKKEEVVKERVVEKTEKIVVEKEEKKTEAAERNHEHNHEHGDQEPKEERPKKKEKEVKKVEKKEAPQERAQEEAHDLAFDGPAESEARPAEHHSHKQQEEKPEKEERKEKKKEPKKEKPSDDEKQSSEEKPKEESKKKRKRRRRKKRAAEAKAAEEGSKGGGEKRSDDSPKPEDKQKSGTLREGESISFD